MYCAQCGTINQDAADTCELCGSLLGSPAGSQACPTCGSQIGDHDQYCRSCGADLGSQPVSAANFGPSFVENDNLNADFGQLPAWLQELAQESDMQPTAGASASSQPAPSASPDGSHSNPNAFQGFGGAPTPSGQAQPTNFTSDASSGANQTDDGLSLLGEDDLPDWLRALGESEESPAPAPHEAPPPAAPQGPSEFVAAVPTVSRAWLARRDTVERDQELATRTDFTSPVGSPQSEQSSVATDDAAPPVPPAQPARESGWRARSKARAAKAKQKQAAAVSPMSEIAAADARSDKSGATGTGGKLLRVLLLLLLVAVVILVGLYLVLMGGVDTLQNMLVG